MIYLYRLIIFLLQMGVALAVFLTVGYFVWRKWGEGRGCLEDEAMRKHLIQNGYLKGEQP